MPKTHSSVKWADSSPDNRLANESVATGGGTRELPARRQWVKLDVLCK